jgi:hypothetical protein
MSDQFFYLQLKFSPKIGHTFTDEREVVVEVPKDLVQRKSERINESLRRVVALDLAKSAALGTFPNEAERAVNLYDGDPPIWYQDRPPVMNERPCDHEEPHKSMANSLGIPMSNSPRLLCVTNSENKKIKDSFGSIQRLFFVHLEPLIWSE